MRHRDTEFQRKRKQSGERKRFFAAVAIPLVVVILVAVIVFADRKKEESADADPKVKTEAAADEGPETGDADQAAEAAAGADQASEADMAAGADPAAGGDQESDGNQEADGSQDSADNSDADQISEAAAEKARSAEISSEPLLPDTDPEILSLMKEYFKARESADAETMNRLYGVGEVGVVTLEAQKTRMRSNSKYIRSFDHVTTYVRDGLTPDSRLVYSTADISFHSVQTAAPMIMWCYVTKQEDGSYRIWRQEELSAETLQYIDIQGRSEEVRSLASGVNTALKEALQSDADLNEVYGVLRDGSPVYDRGETEAETGAVQILDEKTAQIIDEEAAQNSDKETMQTSNEESAQQDNENVSPAETCVDDPNGESTVIDDGASQEQ